MSYLLYASNEMFSSTQLIRKSKDIFDKLISQDIDKAVILRDGKPNFMLLEFTKYEEIMTEYIKLKGMFNNKSLTLEQIKPDIINDIDSIKNEEETIQKIELEKIDDEDVSELKKVLEKIEALDLDESFIDEVKDELKEKSNAQIKEFWN